MARIINTNYIPASVVTTMYCVFLLIVLASAPALTAASSKVDTSGSAPNACIIPPHPDNGRHVSISPKTAQPGESVETVALNYTCQGDYRLVGAQQIFCVSGTWSDSVPKCERFCKLDKDPSTDYRCRTTDAEVIKGCDEYIPSGASVQVACRAPLYYSAEPLPAMKCVDGVWDYKAKCSAECGRLRPTSVSLVLDGRSSPERLPWLAGIYSKTTKPYMQICGGTLVSKSVVLSGAHCFWGRDSLVPKEDFAVALGKVYRPWDSIQEDVVHKSDVKNIHIPSTFLGTKTNFANDIAVVIMEKPVQFTVNIAPICLNFDINLENHLLTNGNLGKVGGWNYVPSKGISPITRIFEVPYMDTVTCIAQLPEQFKSFVSSDKICVGSRANSTSLCRGLSGAGLAFPSFDKGIERYYLSGIMSTAPITEQECAHEIVLFTRISSHEQFLKQYL